MEVYGTDWLPNVRNELKIRFWRKRKAHDGSALEIIKYGAVYRLWWTPFGEIRQLIRSPRFNENTNNDTTGIK